MLAIGAWPATPLLPRTFIDFTVLERFKAMRQVKGCHGLIAELAHTCSIACEGRAVVPYDNSE